MALYIGTNYHPHDWQKDRWKQDVSMMKAAGFTTVRLGHLCWDSYEPEEGIYTFDWFDEVMDFFAEANIGVVLDVSMHPAPRWVHKLCPGCQIYGKNGTKQHSLTRYMEDVDDPAYQKFALRFAQKMACRYKDHPALFAFGLCNELGSGFMSYSPYAQCRFQNWLKKKYHTIDALNQAWATWRWSRRFNSFDEIMLQENEVSIGPPEAWLDMRRFYSEGIGNFIVQLKETIERNAPGIPHSSNHYAEKENLGFDYLQYADQFAEYPGMGFYAGYESGNSEKLKEVMAVYMQRLTETDYPMWCLEFQTGSQGICYGPYGVNRMHILLALLYRTQMVLGWTFRSMLGGEEQYLYGMLGHDGIPGYVLMSRKAAETVKKYVADGGTVIMTGYSSVVDETGKVFGEPRPGYLTDVFGIRVKGFFRTHGDGAGMKSPIIVKFGDEEVLADREYFEELELKTSKGIVWLKGHDICAVSCNDYGNGKAYYLAMCSGAGIDL